MNTLPIKLSITLNDRRTKSQKRALIEEIQDAVEERLELLDQNENGNGSGKTKYGTHKIGHILIESPVGTYEICGE
jgi:hypothetical protein